MYQPLRYPSIQKRFPHPEDVFLFPESFHFASPAANLPECSEIIRFHLPAGRGMEGYGGFFPGRTGLPKARSTSLAFTVIPNIFPLGGYPFSIHRCPDPGRVITDLTGFSDDKRPNLHELSGDVPWSLPSDFQKNNRDYNKVWKILWFVEPHGIHGALTPSLRVPERFTIGERG